MTSAYVEFNVDDIAIKSAQKQQCKWSPIYPYAAVAIYAPELGGTVKFLNENGLLVEEVDSDLGSAVPVKPGVKISCFKWHPRLLAIAMAWENGDLGCFALKKTRSKWVYATAGEDVSPQKAISHIEWINDGEDLMTDVSGTAFIWSLDELSLNLTCTATHQLNDQINDTVATKSTSRNSVVYLGSNSGVVYQMMTATGTINDVIQMEFGIKRLLYFGRRHRLIVITESLLLCQYSVSPTDSQVSEVSKVKLSGSNRGVGAESISVLMIDESIGLIGICITGERVIRLWQLETGHNAAVIVAESVESNWAGVTTLDFGRGLLVAGTSNNNVIVWKRNSGLEFYRVSQITVKGSVKHLSVGQQSKIACTTNSHELYLIEEQLMCAAYSRGVAVAQVGAKLLKFFWSNEENRSCELKLETPIRSVTISNNGKIVGVKVTGSKETHFHKIYPNFSTEYIMSIVIEDPSNQMVIHENVVWYITASGKDETPFVQLFSHDLDAADERKVSLPLDQQLAEAESKAVGITGFDLNNDNLLIVLSQGDVYSYFTYQLKGNDCTLVHGPQTLNAEMVKLAKVNSTGSMVALIAVRNVAVLKVGSGDVVKLPTEVKEPHTLYWSSNEARLLCYKHSASLHIVICSEVEITVRPYDQIEVDTQTKLIGFEVPHIYLLEGSDTVKVAKQSLTEFEGLSLATTKIMIDFLTASSLDLNHMIKTINQRGENNTRLWMNLARISVKCRDVNMGLYCVSKLKNARIAKDVRKELASSNDPASGLALLAVNLGLFGEAEDLLKSCGNRLALSRFFQGRNQWDKAIECVDRVNLKTVYYNFAKHLEMEEGNVHEAVKYYEKSNTNVFEVPRMLFDVDGNSILQAYCLADSTAPQGAQGGQGAQATQGEDKTQLVKWWGQYCESLGDINQALTAYEKGNDYYNLVRLLCYTGETEKAKAIVANNSDQIPSKDAALLHLGRHLETSNPMESISYYLSCGAIKHALRVCKVNELTNELIKITVNYGSKADAKELITKYIDSEDEASVNPEALVQLYSKCGQTNRAIQLSLKHRTWTQLREILRNEMEKSETNEKSQDISDATLEAALDTLRSDSDIIDIAIDLLLLAKNDHKLTLIQNLITEYNVEINERLIDKVEKLMKEETNEKLTLSLAEMSLQQGKYVIAAKLFNTLGDRMGSIKALIRTGQTERVINYANIARDKGVYKIAANYLQTVSFDGDVQVISNFYRKAGAKVELERYMNKDK